MESNCKVSRKRRLLTQLLLAVAFLAVLVGGWFYPLLGYFIPACMLFGLGVAAFSGRLWCNWMCPRGSFYDSMTAPISPSKPIPRLLRSTGFRAGAMALLMAFLVTQLVLRWPDPVGMGQAFMIMLTATTLLGVVLAMAVHPRTWCYLCPIGTMSNWIGGARRPVKIQSELCTTCKLCGKVCPMQVEPYKFKAEGLRPVADRDCLRCGLCVSACPKKALGK